MEIELKMVREQGMAVDLEELDDDEEDDSLQ